MKLSSTMAAGVLAAALLALSASQAAADPTLREQVDQAGDFVLFGNTLAQECAAAAPAPTLGTIGTCPDDNPTAPDVFWRSDDPQAGQARAASNIARTDARSTAMLVLPQGATITYARLYWAAMSNATGPDTTARIERSTSGLDTMVSADASYKVNENGSGSRFWYQATADVTAIVQSEGAGAFRVSDVEAIDLVGLNNNHPVVAWYMVVFYAKAGDPPRNLALFDGLDRVTAGNPKSATLAGFLVPTAGFDAKLGVVAFEGELAQTGDALSFDGATLSDARNPADNFFNASRSLLGAAVSVTGDLPQLSGAPGSMSGVDMDVVDVKSLLVAGQTSAQISASSSQESYLLAAFVTSISTLKPDFDSSQKKLIDLNGGAIRRGDELEYEIDVTNAGSDAAIDTVVTDVVPKGVTYVKGSTRIVSGKNDGKKTDAAGDDQATFDTATHTLTVRIGDGANATQGGKLAIGESTVVSFHVTVDDDASGTISNQALIEAQGEKGAPAEATPTDGNGVAPGAPPTDAPVDECEIDADCKAPEPLCDIASTPQVCVACVTSDDCDDTAKPDCSTRKHVCECAAGAGKCTDMDGDGLSDGAEATIGTDPNDADSDDDGTPDGGELAPDTDSDGDGLINALDPDSDDDGLFDGTEQGFGCDGNDVDVTRGRCRPDADGGATTTNPVKADTDAGGTSDGSEDTNLDGAVDAGETDPSPGHSGDDGAASAKDSDGDGLSDGLERVLHSNPKDQDSDDDGLLDGDEANPSEDTDGDGLINILDVDSDDDGLFDGTELGRSCTSAATDAKAKHCRADGDAGKTKTSPLLRDTDGGGASDGSEDANRNGIVDAKEQDPTSGHAKDDGKVADKDGDGLSDALEDSLGTDKNDKDSDDDGVPDGAEPNPQDDTDGDGKIDALDEDSDGDGLFDGTELGKSCDDAAIDASKKHCVADADGGATTTSALNPDTDFGGKDDGVEDANHDGKRDSGELDPNDPQDDKLGEPCSDDADCGDAQSGVVCDAKLCALGCRGSGGNACKTGLLCSSSDDSIGQCSMPSSDGGVAGSGGMAGSSGAGAAGVPGATTGARLGGGGCACGVMPLGTGSTGRAAWLAFAALAYVLRRRRTR